MFRCLQAAPGLRGTVKVDLLETSRAEFLGRYRHKLFHVRSLFVRKFACCPSRPPNAYSTKNFEGKKPLIKTFCGCTTKAQYVFSPNSFDSVKKVDKPFGGHALKPPAFKVLIRTLVDCPKDTPKKPACRPVIPQVKKQKEETCKRAIPANPCCPHFPKANYWKYKKFFLFLCIPVIIYQTLHAMCADKDHHSKKIPCRDFEYMRRRTKRFPWGDGKKSLFHNDEVNALPGECVAQPPMKASADCQ